jgi:hypothetical protein
MNVIFYVLTTIALSYLANVLTPYVNNLFALILRGSRSHFGRRKKQKILQEFKKVKFYVDNRSLFLEDIIIYLVKSIVIGSFLVLSNILIASFDFKGFTKEIFESLILIFNLFSLLLIINLGMNMIDIYISVKDFEKYKASVLPFIDEEISL